MPNDIFTLSLLCDELRPDLLNRKIQSVFLSKNSNVYLEIVSKERKIVYLVLSTNKQNTIFFLTTKKPQKNEIQSNFSQLFRKHIIGSIIKSFELSSNDRVLTIQTIQNNELYEERIINIIFEMSAQKSNIILLDSNNIILGANESFFNEKRCIFSGHEYIYPKILLRPNIESVCATFGKATMAEYEYLINEKGKESTTEFFNNYLYGRDKTHYPCVIFKGDSVLGYFLYPYESIINKNDNIRIVNCSTLNESIELFSENIEQYNHFVNNFRNERIFVEKTLKSYFIRLSTINENLMKTNILNDLLNEAELLKCNLHLVMKDSHYIDCWDFYKNKSARITINPLISPSKNLEEKYKKYYKLKSTINYSINAKDMIEHSISHLESIKFALTLSDEQTDISAIVKELSDHFNYKIKEKLKLNSTKKSIDNYIQFYQDGFKVLIGKNNLQNDNITFRVANKQDMWLHVSGATGSHTIIKSNGKNIPSSIVCSVASYSAYYSSQRNNTKVMVDFTNVKNIKKGKNPGSVIIKDKDTIVVSPVSPKIN